MTSYVPLLKNSFLLAGGASFAALLTVLAWSYAVPFSNFTNRWLLGCIFMPFFIPQISFLLGIQISLSRVGLDGTWLALIWVHMIFILPYTWLIVIPARRALDHRLDHLAATLGASGWRRFITLHMPLMAYPLATALFIKHFRARVRWMSRWSQSLRILAGLVLVVMGVMVLTGQMTRFASWMLSAFPVLGRLG